MKQGTKVPKNKGFAFVQYEGKEEAEKAIQEMNSKLLHGKNNVVNFSFHSFENSFLLWYQSEKFVTAIVWTYVCIWLD